MDERKLMDLFRDAVADVPPPSFDEQDVVAESNRQRIRRRNGIMVGSTLGVAVLASGAVLGVALWRGSDAGPDFTAGSGVGAPAATGNNKAHPHEVPNEETAPRVAEGGPAQDQSFPPGSPKQGGDSGGNAAPSGAGGTPSGCGQADRELAAALAGELLAAASSDPVVSEAAPAAIGCPSGARGVAYLVTHDGRSGVISFVLTQNGDPVAHPPAGSAEGSVSVFAVTDDGRQVVLVAEPEAGSTEPPFRLDLQRMADHLAARF